LWGLWRTPLPRHRRLLHGRPTVPWSFEAACEQGSPCGRHWRSPNTCQSRRELASQGWAAPVSFTRGRDRDANTKRLAVARSSPFLCAAGRCRGRGLERVCRVAQCAGHAAARARTEICKAWSTSRGRRARERTDRNGVRGAAGEHLRKSHHVGVADIAVCHESNLVRLRRLCDRGGRSGFSFARGKHR
jgi:hypothetical protein